jgi:hypothetical protein
MKYLLLLIGGVYGAWRDPEGSDKLGAFVFVICILGAIYLIGLTIYNKFKSRKE